MSVSDITSPLYAGQQIGGIQGVAAQTFGNFKTKFQTASADVASQTAQLGNSVSAAQVQLSTQAQALLLQAQAAATNTNATPTTTATATATTPNTAAQTTVNTAATNQAFLNFANQTPAQRMYSQILSSLGLTQQQLDAMTPDQRQAAENKIAEMIKQKMAAQTGIVGGNSAGVASSSVSAAAAAVAGAAS